MFKTLCVTTLVACGFFTVMDIRADASYGNDAGTVLAPSGLKTVHVPRKYSQAEAIAKALAKFPGHKVAYVKSTKSVWVVALKK